MKIERLIFSKSKINFPSIKYNGRERQPQANNKNGLKFYTKKKTFFDTANFVARKLSGKKINNNYQQSSIIQIR